MTMGNHDRSSDAIIARVEQKLDDHMNNFDTVQADLRLWQDAHYEWCRMEFAKMDAKINPLKEAFEVVNRPAKAIGWTVIAVLTGGCAYAGERLSALIFSHWKQ